MSDKIVVRGARGTISRTSTSRSRAGASPSSQACRLGKSTLAFDTLYAEGRRYIGRSPYAKRFERIGRPDVDDVTGLSPAIDRATKHDAQLALTVGTATEIYDYLRLLFARLSHTCATAVG
jgi:excinuclease ABC subunit A